MADEVFVPEHKQTVLTIDGREYSITVFLSMNDVMELVEECNKENTAPRLMVARLIQRKITASDNELPSAEAIAAQSDGLFQAYIDALIETDEGLRTKYEKHAEEPDVCSRFFLAVRDEWRELCKSLADALPKFASPVTKVLDEALPAINAFQNANISAALESTRKITEIVKGAIDLGSRLRDVLEPYQQMAAQITQGLVGIVGQFADIIGSIHIPTISEERKEAVRLSHDKWGRYGWTIIPNAEFSLFDDCPETITEANKAALAFCKPKDMELFFSELMNVRGVKKSDVEAAKFCFRSKQYKPCAMILFSLLDAKLIRLQRKEDYQIRRDKTKYRASGGLAAKLLAKHIRDEKDIENTLFALYAFTNLFACLETVFADGKDFRWKPAVINRNFVDHGMWTKTITRKDCVQVFLLYYNFLELLDTIRE